MNGKTSSKAQQPKPKRVAGGSPALLWQKAATGKGAPRPQHAPIGPGYKGEHSCAGGPGERLAPTEAAFLGTILHKLAERLSLPGAEIDQEIKAALPPLYKSNKQASDRITGFTLGSIELFSTWQGTIAYGAMVLVLIYGLNLQQRQLASANGISIAPISPNPTLKKPETPTKQLLKLYPELRPLP